MLLLTKDGASGDVFPTISDALALRDDLSGMSLLLDVVRSLVGDAVNDPAAAYTVFAPSSDALAAFLVSSNTTLEDLKRNPGSAMSLMGLHLVPGTRLLSSMAMEGQDYVLGTMGETHNIQYMLGAVGVVLCTAHLSIGLCAGAEQYSADVPCT